MDFSVIIPIFNEHESIMLLYDSLRPVMDSLGKEYEIIFVNDGSKDGSFSILKAIKNACEKVVIVNLADNYGESAALQAGFDAALGDIIITMDGDLQFDPEDIHKLLRKLNSSPKYQCIYGWRVMRSDFLLRRLVSKFANFLIRFLTGIKVYDTGCTFSAYKKEAVKEINLSKGMHRFIPVLLSKKGYNIAEAEVNHRSRRYGRSHYGILNRIPGTLTCLAAICANRLEPRHKGKKEFFIKEVIR